MSDDWRPYEPSLEAERSAVYERAELRAIGGLVVAHEELRACPLALFDRFVLDAGAAYRRYGVGR